MTGYLIKYLFLNLGWDIKVILVAPCNDKKLEKIKFDN